MAKQEKITMYTRMMKLADFNHLRDQLHDDEESGCYETEAYLSENNETLYIFRDVDDYTVHAVVSQFYSHSLVHITCSPRFLELINELI